MTKIFDTQMNVGKNLFGPNSTISDYLDNAYSNGVVKAIMIPTGTHELKLDDGTIERSCLWVKGDRGVIFKRVITDEKGNVLEEQINPRNPYSLMNNFCLNLLRKLNNSQKKIHFYFCPKLHPALDTEEEVSKYAMLEEVIAFKIQGIASYTSPKDIPKWLVMLLKDAKKPLIIHTDYRRKEKGDGLDDIIRKNIASEWVKWLLENNLKACLAHGLRLDPEAIKLVNESDLFLVGLGPDLMLNQEKNGLVVQNVDYLKYLLRNVDIKKISFNYDYRWNVTKRGKWNDLDWDSPKRVIETANMLEIEDYLDDIFFNNAVRFFEVHEEK